MASTSKRARIYQYAKLIFVSAAPIRGKKTDGGPVEFLGFKLMDGTYSIYKHGAIGQQKPMRWRNRNI